MNPYSANILGSLKEDADAPKNPNPAESRKGWSTHKSQTPAAPWCVLVADGNRGEADFLVQELRRHGYNASSTETGHATLQNFSDFELVLLDLDFPDLDGLEICRGIRSVSNIAIIAVTSRGTELDRVLGLQAGADDYLVKPYGFQELMARMEAVMRRATQPVAAKVISYGPLFIDASRREVSLDGRPVEVTRKEFDLLYILASRPQVVVPRKRLMQLVWGGSWSRRTVDTHVSSLRNKLGSSSWIITVRGVGFRLGTLEEVG